MVKRMRRPTGSVVLGSRLRELRTARGLNQRKVCDYTGVHHTTISGIENGWAMPGLLTAYALANLYGADLMELIEEMLESGR